MPDLRTTAREIFLEAIASLDIRTAVTDAVQSPSPNHLQIAQTPYDLSHFDSILVIAIGKAALPMAEGLLHALQPALTPAHTLSGIVVGSTLPSTPDPRLHYCLGSHPLPDAASADAAARVLDLLHTATERTLVFFLLSGGASAMVELPLDPAVSLPDLAAFHRTLVHSGLPISDMNTLRKHLSAVKGGRLATAAPLASQCTLLVSDVPPSQPEVIGSGPSLPDATTLADCRRLLATTPLANTPLPPAIRSFLLAPDTPETPKATHPAFQHATTHLLLSSDHLALAARQAAQRRGFLTVIDTTPDEWPLVEAATYLLHHLQETAHAHPGQPVCLISPGEISVPVTTSHPGTGGRNQHFALHCATQIASSQYPIAILSAGSDGTDGNSPAAGAVADNATLARAAALGLDPLQALATFNSYPLFNTLGDALHTGPTGNNLRDLRLLLANADIA